MFNDQDKTLIKELNLGHLTEARQAAALGRFYETLKLKVGMALEDKLSDEQLVEFEKISRGADDDQATIGWLQQAIPGYEQVVAREMTELVQEIQRSAARFREIISE